MKEKYEIVRGGRSGDGAERKSWEGAAKKLKKEYWRRENRGKSGEGVAKKRGKPTTDSDFHPLLIFFN